MRIMSRHTGSLCAIFVILAFCIPTMAADNGAKSKDYTFGKPTQQVTPKYVRETQRSDGKRSVVYGNQRDPKTGKVTGPHGHSVSKNGKIEYARTPGGKVLTDDRKKKR